MHLQSVPKRIVMRLGGGSLLGASTVLNSERIADCAKIFARVLRVTDQLVIVTGGAGAHQFIEVARRFSASENTCDKIGSSFCDTLAEIVKASIELEGEDVYPVVPRSIEQVRLGLRQSNCVVVGSLDEPVSSSDSAAAYVAENARADLMVVVKAWNLRDKLPEDAFCYTSPFSICVAQLNNRTFHLIEKAGARPFFDQISLKILQRSATRTALIAIGDLNLLPDWLASNNLESAVELVGICGRHTSAQ